MSGRAVLASAARSLSKYPRILVSVHVAHYEVRPMPIEINFFQLFLQEAISFGIGSVLRSVTRCFQCDERADTSVGNCQVNHLGCKNCNAEVMQFTNACEFTINPRTNQVAHAAFAPPGVKWRWADGGWFEGSRLQIPYFVRADGLRDRSLVLETSIEDYHDQSVLATHSSVLDCSHDSTVWRDHYHYWSAGTFEKRSSGILVVSSRLVSEFRDEVFRDNRIIHPWK
jgi:hypothetical protein